MTIYLMVSCQKDEGKAAQTPGRPSPPVVNSRQIERCLEKKFQLKEKRQIGADEFIEIAKNSKLECSENLQELEKYLSRHLSLKTQEELLDEIQEKLF